MTNINRETTPTAITDDIILLAADLGAAPSAFLPVSAPADALDGDCFQNVDPQCRSLAALRSRLPRPLAILIDDDLRAEGKTKLRSSPRTKNSPEQFMPH